MKTTEIDEMILEKWREANDYPYGEDFIDLSDTAEVLAIEDWLKNSKKLPEFCSSEHNCRESIISDYVRRWMIDILACNMTDDLQELASILEFEFI